MATSVLPARDARRGALTLYRRQHVGFVFQFYNGLRAQVQKGLAPGDKVIVHFGDSVRDGVSYTERRPLR